MRPLKTLRKSDRCWTLPRRRSTRSLGGLYLEAKDLKSARAGAGKAGREIPELVHAVISCSGRLYLATGKPALAEKAFRRSAGDRPRQHRAAVRAAEAGARAGPAARRSLKLNQRDPRARPGKQPRAIWSWRFTTARPE
ncbi:MAG: hypothetical protein MZV70_76160 [Desulfobacterales bacterium]|nr:hypothetical protein [Desulfobacterales bacterium]